MGLKDRAKKLNSGNGVPFMEGREKGEFFPLNSIVTVDQFGFINGENGQYVVLSFREFPENFFFGSSVATEKFSLLEAENTPAEVAEALEEGIPVIFTERKSKNKRTYTTVEFYPEADIEV